MEPNPVSPPSLPRWRNALELVSTITIIIAAIALTAMAIRFMWLGPVSATGRAAQAPEPIPKEPLSLAGAAVMGRRDAPVALVEYSDFQCPASAKVALEVLPDIEHSYVDTGRVLVAFRYFPLEKIHPFAFAAATAAECAGAQGQFWPMHDLLFMNQKQLDQQSLIERAQRVGLGIEDFKSCLAGPAGPKVRQQIADSTPLTIRGTPTMFIGTMRTDGQVQITRRFLGVPRQAEMAGALDDALKASQQEKGGR